MIAEIAHYNTALPATSAAICAALANIIVDGLPEAEGKIWHGGPVWFIAGNPIVGYWQRKHNVQLLFWSGQSFHALGLEPEGKFKAAAAKFDDATQIDAIEIRRWLNDGRRFQWDYKNIVKRRGILEKIGDW